MQRLKDAAFVQLMRAVIELVMCLMCAPLDVFWDTLEFFCLVSDSSREIVPRSALKTCQSGSDIGEHAIRNTKRNSKKLHWPEQKFIQESTLILEDQPIFETVERKFESLNRWCAVEIGRMNYILQCARAIQSSRKALKCNASDIVQFDCPFCFALVTCTRQQFNKLMRHHQDRNRAMMSDFTKTNKYKCRNLHATTALNRIYKNSAIPETKLYYDSVQKRLRLTLCDMKQFELYGEIAQRRAFNAIKETSKDCPICFTRVRNQLLRKN